MNKAKELRQEARQLHERAKAILDEYDGKEIPAEKKNEVDAILDDVEKKIDEAQRLERTSQLDSYLNEPVDKPLQIKVLAPEEAKVSWEGQELAAKEVREMLNLTRFQAFMPDGSDLYGQYKAAFREYLRHGDRAMTAESIKALSVGDAQAGGYLVQDTFINQLLVRAREISAMRQISRVLPMVPVGSVIVPTEDNLFSDATWTSELGTGVEDTVKPFGQRRLSPKPLAKRIKVSNTLLRVPTFDVEAYVRDCLAYKFAVPEEYAFIQGTGDATQPRGILETPSLPTYTTATSNTLTGDDIINWVYTLPAAYAGQARILCNRSFIRHVRTLKTTAGDYVWQPSLQGGLPNQIVDTPYVVSDQFPTGLDANDAYEDNAIIAVIGDFSYYWIVDALGMTVQRLNELYAETNEVGFIGRKEVDGQAVLAEAFLALEIKA